MGIREHFKGQPGEEEIKLSDLNLEGKEKKPKEMINPREEIESNQEEILKSLETLESEEKWEDYLSLASNVKFIYPEIFDNFEISSTAFENIKEMMDKYRRDGDNSYGWLQFSICIKEFVNVFPDKLKDFDLDERDKEGMKSNLDFFDSEDLYSGYMNAIIDLRIAFPDHDFGDMGVNDKWEDVEKELNRYISVKSWKSVANTIEKIKIVFPEKMEHIAVNDEMKKGVKETLNDFKGKGDWKSFSELLLSVEIINAKEAKVTDNGLEISIPSERDSFEDKTAKRPERKQL